MKRFASSILKQAHTSTSAAGLVGSSRLGGGFLQPRRGMANAQQLAIRLKTVKNIQKITKAMKMVAAAKLRQVQALLEDAREFQSVIVPAWKQELEDSDGNDAAKKVPKKHLIVCFTSDRGLCGGINSAVTKLTRLAVKDDQSAGVDTQVMLIGEKSKAGLERLMADKFTTSISEAGKGKAITFAESCLIAEHILSHEYDKCTMFYNWFRSAIAYDTLPEPLLSLDWAKSNEKQWEGYSFEGERRDVMESLYEFRLAVQTYAQLVEGATSEQSARMQAMENSTNNATDMIAKLTLLYNRTRQAKITTELVEIVAGATAAEEMSKAEE